MASPHSFKFLAYIYTNSSKLQASFTYKSKMTTLEIDQHQDLTQQNFLLDCLYCEELYSNDDDDKDDDYSSSLEEEHHFLTLLCKEEKTHINKHALESNKFFLMEVRREMLEWMKRVSLHHKLSNVTLVLAVNYFDKFILTVGFQRERPWLTQLAAIASLSLASKFEEVHVPLLLEFQVDCKYVFEAKTIKRMELLMLSTLEWNMNSVTPFSYFGYLIWKFKLKNCLQWEISSIWETLILSAIVDPRFLHHDPSVIAAAAMMQTLKELGLWKETQHQIDLIDTLKHNKDKVEECCKFIQEISNTEKRQHKRKCCDTGDSSPTRVLDLVLSETSKESLDQPVPKKCRTFESHT